ncbi:hypothetical protein CBM2634_U120006 [Cupriavidus taiwanensis]|uniref:Uncharacterized protein n=1 Tax=Cupriavidus taiwanensis TaxID=164546 RepID=A0A375JER4_9BURK|nr:hypothetical protein CBM2634_U120006 [Cupriavidus taiwanensis]
MPRASSAGGSRVTGKGNKTRLVPATDELIAELARYRRAPRAGADPAPRRDAPAAAAGDRP